MTRIATFIAAAAMLVAYPAAAVTPLTGDSPAALPAPAQPPAPDLATMGNPAQAHSALPEPATWFTLIAGFALIGFAARWRRSTAPQSSPWPDAR